MRTCFESFAKHLVWYAQAVQSNLPSADAIDIDGGLIFRPVAGWSVSGPERGNNCPCQREITRYWHYWHTALFGGVKMKHDPNCACQRRPPSKPKNSPKRDFEEDARNQMPKIILRSKGDPSQVRKETGGMECRMESCWGQ